MSNAAARSRIELAVKRLGCNYPLHAGILALWGIEESAAVSTMGVGFRGNRLCLVFAPDFVESIGMNELEGVLHHEVNHVMFDHVFHEPEANEDENARIVAEEVTVNEWVPEPLPGKPVLLSQYPFLPANETTEIRYRKLRGRVSGENRGKSGSGCGPQSAGTCLAGTGKSGGQGPNGAKAGRVPTVDDHSTWSEIRKDSGKASRAAQMDVAMAWGGLTPKQRDAQPDPIAGSARKAVEAGGFDLGVGIGTDSGDEEEKVGPGSARVPWQVVLRKHIGRIRERRPVFGRPPRRFPDMAGIIPGKGRFSRKTRVMAVVDTSGSMTGPMLADISAELGLMARHFDVIVVECDETIRQIYPYRPIESVKGRGWTDFRPPFKPDFLKAQQPDVVVYFTDGDGPAPEKQPAVPVIWAITEGGKKPVLWGMEVALSEPKMGPNVPNFSTGLGIFRGGMDNSNPMQFILDGKTIIFEGRKFFDQ